MLIKGKCRPQERITWEFHVSTQHLADSGPSISRQKAKQANPKQIALQVMTKESKPPANMLYYLISTKGEENIPRTLCVCSGAAAFHTRFVDIHLQTRQERKPCHEKELIAFLSPVATSRADAGSNSGIGTGWNCQCSSPSFHKSGSACWLKLSDSSAVYPEGAGWSTGQRRCHR